MKNKEILVGIDVDSKYLVCCRLKNNRQAHKTFGNTPQGHGQLLEWVAEDTATTKVCMEATGVYSFSVALALSEHEQVTVSVVNPRLIKHFAQAILQRGKTDQMDAYTILEYLLRMPFDPWRVPNKKLITLQLLSRRVLQLTIELRREASRLHAARRMGEHSHFLVNDIKVNMRHIERRIAVVGQHMATTVAEESRLQSKLDQLKSITGIADKTGPRLLAELASLPTDMSARQWVAYAGLDPKPHESGSMVKPRRISKLGNRYLRDTLYLPAVVASRFDPNVKGYYNHLIERGKKPKQALVAIMRKLLLAIWAMFKNGEDWAPEKFYHLPE